VNICFLAGAEKKTSPGNTFLGSIGGYTPKNFGGEFIPYIMYVLYPKDKNPKEKFQLKTNYRLKTNLFPLNKKPLLIG